MRFHFRTIRPWGWKSASRLTRWAMVGNLAGFSPKAAVRHERQCLHDPLPLQTTQRHFVDNLEKPQQLRNVYNRMPCTSHWEWRACQIWTDLLL